MELKFKENQAYLLSKNVYRLIQFHVEKEGFLKHESLKRRIEKVSLCIISLLVKASLCESQEDKKKTSFRTLHLAHSLYALYDLSLDLKLIDKKDLSLMESALKELIEEIKKN